MPITDHVARMKQLIQRLDPDKELRPLLAGGAKNFSLSLQVDESGTTISMSLSDAEGNAENYSSRTVIAPAVEPQEETSPERI